MVGLALELKFGLKEACLPTPQEIVQSDRTNSPIEYIVFRDLVVFHRTIINLREQEEARPELVKRLQTIIESEEGGKVAMYIEEHPVFTVPVLRAIACTARTHTYEVVKTLMLLGVVKRTRYKAEPPTPSSRGPRPYIHTLAHVEIEDAADARIRQAQLEYVETFQRFDPDHLRRKAAEAQLDQISLVVVDYFRGRGRSGGHYAPTRMEVVDFIKDAYVEVEGQHRATLANRILRELWKNDR